MLFMFIFIQIKYVFHTPHTRLDFRQIPSSAQWNILRKYRLKSYVFCVIITAYQTSTIKRSHAEYIFRHGFYLISGSLSGKEQIMKKNTQLIGLLFCLVAAIVWGFAFVAQTVGAQTVTPFLFNFSRFFIGTISVIPLIFIFERRADNKEMKKRTVIAGLIAGTVLFAASHLQQLGVQYTDSAGKSGFITGLYMIIVPIIGLMFGRKTGLFTWIGAFLGVGGLFLICMSGGALTFTNGDWFLIGCAIVYAIHITVIDRFGQNIYSLRFALTQFATATAWNFICTLIFEELSLEPVVGALVPVLYCGIMSVGVAYTCQIMGQKYSEPTSASIVLSTESMFSAIGAAIILHERMTGAGYIGCVLIFAGILLTQVNPKKKRKSAEQ